MTFGFALLLSGWVLLDAGWKGVTPFQVLQGLTVGMHGAGGVLRGTGQDVTVAFTGGAPSYAPEGGAQGEPEVSSKFHKGNVKKREKELAANHPELKPGIRIVTAIVMAAFPGLQITATTGGEHTEGSYHYVGRAVDLAAPMTPQGEKEMNRAAKWISATIGHMLTEGIHNPGLSVKNKKKVPPSFWGSETWEAHKNHIHLAV